MLLKFILFHFIRHSAHCLGNGFVWQLTHHLNQWWQWSVAYGWTTGEKWFTNHSHMCNGIDLLHNSHNAPVPYPTMHYFVTEMCTCVHISVKKCALWDICLIHCRIVSDIEVFVFKTQRFQLAVPLRYIVMLNANTYIFVYTIYTSDKELKHILPVFICRGYNKLWQLWQLVRLVNNGIHNDNQCKPAGLQQPARLISDKTKWDYHWNNCYKIKCVPSTANTEDINEYTELFFIRVKIMG